MESFEPLPSVETVSGWSREDFVKALRHGPDCPDGLPDFRQLIHVAYKVAFELGDEYICALKKYLDIVGRSVTHNLLERHILPLFGSITEKEAE